MPWLGRVRYEELLEQRVTIATLAAKLEAEQSRRNQAETDYARLQEDFKALAVKAGRSRSSVQPFFDKDPFAEDERMPTVFLTPDSHEELGINLQPEFTTQNGEAEAGDAD